MEVNRVVPKHSFLRRVLGITAIFLGMLPLLLGGYFLWTADACTAGSVSITQCWPDASVRFMLVVGTAMIALGILLQRKRFSLQWLMASMLFSGAMGCLPHVIYRKNLLSIKVVVSQALTPEKIQNVQALLKPEIAIATLPRTLRQKLNLSESCIDAIQIYPSGETVHFDINFANGINQAQRATLGTFYIDYCQRLIPTIAPGGIGFRGSMWDAYRSEWEKSLPAF